MAEQPVDAAIDHVLRHEREARDAVAACHQQGKAQVEAARVHARHILDRAEARVEALQQHCDRAIESAVAELQAQDKAGAAPAGDKQRDISAGLEPMVRALAAEILGVGE